MCIVGMGMKIVALTWEMGEIYLSLLFLPV